MVYPGSVSLNTGLMSRLNLSARDIELRDAGRPWVVGG